MSLLPSPNKSLWQFLGQPLGWLYGAGAWLHRASYVYGPFKQAHFEPLTICIGNLSVGGTGKSPHVLYVQDLLGAAEQTAMISRGYGRQTKGVQWVHPTSTSEEVGDEPLHFKQTYPKAAVLVAEKRAEGIAAALAQQPDLQTILLDDAMQHWALQATCTLMLTTFEAPFFQQTLLPFGCLREFKRGYKRADVIIVTKCPPSIKATSRAAYKKAIAPLPHQQVLFSWLAYQPLYELLSGTVGPLLQEPLEILLLTGIANTQALEEYLSRHLLTCQKFPDHHLFSLKDLQAVQARAQGKLVITTEKDATKLRPLLQQHPELQFTIYVLPIQVKMAASDETWLLEYLQAKKKELTLAQKKSH